MAHTSEALDPLRTALLAQQVHQLTLAIRSAVGVEDSFGGCWRSRPLGGRAPDKEQWPGLDDHVCSVLDGWWLVLRGYRSRRLHGELGARTDFATGPIPTTLEPPPPPPGGR